MYCIPLHEATDPAIAGGKAANLARVAALGYLVPPSFVVTREALRRFIELHALEPELSAMLAGDAGPDGNEALAARIRSLPLPADVESELRAQLDALLPEASSGLAVRSSAVHEDSAEASFAGVFDSFLELRDADSALAAVRDCWLSAWSPKALAYLRRLKLEPALDAMAVLIQPVAPAVAAGVVLTADPSTGDPSRFVVHAAPGLSADLMSGSGAGDSYVLDWESAEAVEAQPQGNSPVLARHELTDVGRLAQGLDEAFNRRMDIEWAFDGAGKLWVLQARPLTAIPELPPPLAPEDAARQWQLSPYVIPMLDGVPRGFLMPLYADYSMSEMWYRYQPKDIIFTGIWKHERDIYGYRYVDCDPGTDFREFLSGIDAYEAWLVANEPAYRLRWDNRHDELAVIERIARAAAGASLPEQVRAALEARERLWDLNSFGWSGPQALGWMCEGAFRAWVASFGARIEVSDLLGGEESVTFEWAAAVQDLARAYAEGAVRGTFERVPLERVLDELAGSPFVEEYDALCRRFGKTPPSWAGRHHFWRTIWDEGHPGRIRAIRAAMRGETRDVREAREQAVRERDARTAEARGIAAALGEEAAQRFDRFLDWTRYWTQALNDRHGVGVGLLWEREAWWLVAQGLVEAAVISTPEDVLLFRAEDLAAFAENPDTAALRAVFRERRAEYARNRRYSAPEFAGVLPGAHPSEASPAPREAAEGSVLRGQGFGRGTAEGPARILRNLDAATLDSITREDILVVLEENAFAYADWHSLLIFVKGVAAAARPAHHLTQVAREIGVPVIGHVAGLERVRDGQTLRLNAAGGTAEILA